MKRNILYVDDEPENVIVFEAGFEDDFHIWTADSGREALELVEEVNFPVVVADQRMPEMTGVELFDIMRQRHPYTQRIILTGFIDSDAMLESINKGQVFHFVTKPWERSLLMSVLIRAVEAHDMAMANSALTDRLVASERCATLGQVAAQVAHEMGNQLGSLPLLELIEQKYLDHPDLVMMAQFAREMHQRLEELIAEVASFVRFEQEAVPKRPVELADATHELVSFLRFDKGIPQGQFNYKVLARPVISANKVKIQQVLVNLIKNAAYAVRGRTDGQITLSLDRQRNEAVITVDDNGCGMSPETLERIWEPFFTTKGEQGSGLGLDVSRRLIEAHDGTISCQSALGCGTTFVIRLPAAQHAHPGLGRPAATMARP